MWQTKQRGPRVDLRKELLSIDIDKMLKDFLKVGMYFKDVAVDDSDKTNYEKWKTDKKPVIHI